MAEYLNQVDGEWLLFLPDEARMRLVTAMSQAERGIDVAGTLDEELTALVAAAACGTLSGAFELPRDDRDGHVSGGGTDSEIDLPADAPSAKPVADTPQPPTDYGKAGSAKASDAEPSGLPYA